MHYVGELLLDCLILFILLLLYIISLFLQGSHHAQYLIPLLLILEAPLVYHLLIRTYDILELLQQRGVFFILVLKQVIVQSDQLRLLNLLPLIPVLQLVLIVFGVD